MEHKYISALRAVYRKCGNGAVYAYGFLDMANHLGIKSPIDKITQSQGDYESQQPVLSVICLR